MNREHRIKVFEQTQNLINTKYSNEVLQSLNEAVIYTENNNFNIKERKANTKYIVNKQRSFEAAENFLDVCPNKKVAVLNFASAKNPGGGVTKGSGAQEECLCRVSTLYNVITNDKFKKDFYNYHKNISGTLYTDRLIYTPDIFILKDDDYEIVFDKPYNVDVITCAAPNLNLHTNVEFNGDAGGSIITNEELFNIQYSRCMHIIRAASEHNVEVLILGAFGCGVFRNNPTVVAKAMKKALEDSPYKFDRVIFPVYCNDYDCENYNAFKKVFNNTII